MFTNIFCSEIDIPDKSLPVGSAQSPQKSPAGTVTTSTEDMGKRKLQLERRNTKHDQGLTQFSTPNMKNVLYEVTYDEYMQKKSPVKPISHCWNAQQNVYIGCEGGQLLLVDFETRLVKILANPHISVSYIHILTLMSIDFFPLSNRMNRQVLITSFLTKVEFLYLL